MADYEKQTLRKAWFLTVIEDYQKQSIPVKQIFSIEKDGNRIRIILYTGKIHCCYDTIAHMEKLLEEWYFFRITRGTIVNLLFLESSSHSCVHLAHNRVRRDYRIGRGRRAEVYERCRGCIYHPAVDSNKQPRIYWKDDFSGSETDGAPGRSRHTEYARTSS